MATKRMAKKQMNISIDEQAHRRIKLKALEEGTTVSSLIEQFIFSLDSDKQQKRTKGRWYT